MAEYDFEENQRRIFGGDSSYGADAQRDAESQSRGFKPGERAKLPEVVVVNGVEVPVYRKRPVEVPALQMTAENWDELVKFTNYLVRFDREAEKYFVYDKLHDSWIEFFMGDWIMRGPAGEHYPVNKEMFPDTYEAVYREVKIDLHGGVSEARSAE